MYRLTIIASPTNAQPARGVSFAVERGEVSIGRHSENEIVLHSGNVSKKHCVLVVDNTGVITVKDQGSSNGTFVNGQLAHRKPIRPGDRISVGDFVFELRESKSQKGLVPGNNVLPFPGAGTSPGLAGMVPPSTAAPAQAEVIPRTLIGKLSHHFEKFVMPYFYGLNERYEWKMIGIAMLAIFIILNLFISISPLMETQEKSMTKEIAKRATVIAREIAERNTPAFASKQETKSEMGAISHSNAVKAAVIVDMDLRIVAPASIANQSFTRGVESTFAIYAKKEYAKGREEGITKRLDEETVAAVEPIKILNPQLGKNEVVGMVIVSLDTLLANPGAGEMSAVYANAMIMSLLIGLFIFYILYRVTVKPFEIMNQQIDQALRGERAELKSPVHFEEVEPLWTIVDSAVKRLPKGDGMGFDMSGVSLTVNDFLPQFQAFGQLQSQVGVAVLDGQGQVAYLNSLFEDIANMRSETVQGQTIASASGDQAFSVFIQDLIDRAQPGGEGSSDEFEFSGAFFRVQVLCFGTVGSPACYLVTVARKENSQG